jgi:hypothetical protein
MECAFCKKKIRVSNRVERNDTCPNCGNDLRSCKQCNFYDPHAYNECKEVQAERIVDKERANFCEYFVVGNKSKKRINRGKNAKDALEALFKK